MEFSTSYQSREEEIIALFTATFTASEGAAEGALIGGLVRNILTSAAHEDLHVFTTRDNGAIIAAAIFTRMRYSGDPRTVFILSPMAVAPEHQRKGIGQALIIDALAVLRAGGVDVAVTYGDPAYYAKVGFQPVSIDTMPTPLPLTWPHGWLAQSLTGQPLKPMAGRSECIEALHDARYW